VWKTFTVQIPVHVIMSLYLLLRSVLSQYPQHKTIFSFFTMSESSNADVYASEYPPNTTLPADLKAFIKHYYTTVDIHGHHNEYANCFAKDALLVAHGNTVNGRDGNNQNPFSILFEKFILTTHLALRKLHEGMWTSTKKRQHKPVKVFPFGSSSASGVEEWDVMIAGTVEHWGENGGSGKKDMAVRAKYVKDPAEGWLIGFLEVWLSP
jgi:hypothetical protein